jgi:hypothetical protein
MSMMTSFKNVFGKKNANKLPARGSTSCVETKCRSSIEENVKRSERRQRAIHCLAAPQVAHGGF